jgi:septum formation protein
MLRLLSGRTHHILTAVCVRAPDGRISERLSDNKLKVKRLSDSEIAAFIADPSQWDGFAGGYAFQKTFAKFVTQHRRLRIPESSACLHLKRRRC